MTCQEIKTHIETTNKVKIGVNNKENDVLFFRYNYYYLCSKYAEDSFSLNVIGKPINKGYNSVYHGLNKFSDLCETDKKFLSYSVIIRNRFLDAFNIDEKSYILEILPVDNLVLKQKIQRLNKTIQKREKTIQNKQKAIEKRDIKIRELNKQLTL